MAITQPKSDLDHFTNHSQRICSSATTGMKIKDIFAGAAVQGFMLPYNLQRFGNGIAIWLGIQPYGESQPSFKHVHPKKKIPLAVAQAHILGEGLVYQITIDSQGAGGTVSGSFR